MRTTVVWSRWVGRVGVVRFFSVAFAALLVATAGGFFVLDHIRGSEEPTDLMGLLELLDDSLSDPDRAMETAALADRAAALVRSLDLGVESELSVLKRRRDLAYRLPSCGGAYLDAALESSSRFPHSDLVAAVVVEAALGVDDPRTDAILQDYAPRLGVNAFGALRTAAQARLGSLSLPSSEIPPQTFLAAAAAYGGSAAYSADLAVDAALSSILTGDALTAQRIVRDWLSRTDELPDRIVRFQAELAFDFGDRREAAALFSRLPGIEAALRRADSSYLAGDVDAARSAWVSAAASGSGKALYNLAATSQDPAEALAYARRLRSAVPEFPEGAVLFSRLAPAAEGGAALASSKDVLAELELIRLEAPRLGVDRTLARLWLLLNASPGSEATAQWAAWYAATNGRLAEAVRLVQTYGKEDGSSSWSAVYVGLDAALAGRITAAEEAFERAAEEYGDWRLAANTAVLSESRRDTREALRRYEIAASICPRGPFSAELQLRIARLLVVLGRKTDARRALEYALDQDPGNRRVRVELKRLDGR